MHKAVVYLSEEEKERLESFARQQGRPQSEIIRKALRAYVVLPPPDRDFQIIGCFEGDGTSIADIPDEELMKGFGE